MDLVPICNIGTNIKYLLFRVSNDTHLIKHFNFLIYLHRKIIKCLIAFIVYAIAELVSSFYSLGEPTGEPMQKIRSKKDVQQ